MIIEDIYTSNSNGKVRVSAHITYEECARQPLDIYFEVNSEHADYVSSNYESFLLAAFPAALYHKEKRIKIDGDLCSDLLMNIRAAMYLQKSWFGYQQDIPIIEVNGEIIHTIQGSTRETGCFLSGGVDSMASLCRNVKLYPTGHSKRIRHAICVYGMDIGDPNKPKREDLFLHTLELLNGLTNKFGCKLVPVYTNVRLLELNWLFYEELHFGSVLASIAHYLSNRISHCYIALDNRVDYYPPHGSHPFLNKYFNSSLITCESTLDSYMRYEKYIFFKDIREALAALRVCHNLKDIDLQQVNCCRCEKCTRTKLELLGQGVLDLATTFPDKTILIEDVKKLKISKKYQTEFVYGLLKPLSDLGRTDLVKILQGEIHRYSTNSLGIPERIIKTIINGNEQLLNRIIKFRIINK